MGIYFPNDKRSAILILLLFVGLLGNSIVFQHAHRLADGEVIIHSHPYQSNPENDSPFEDHDHSEGEFWLLDLIYHAVYDKGATIAFSKPLLPEFRVELKSAQLAQCTRATLSYVLSFRGPPVV